MKLKQISVPIENSRSRVHDTLAALSESGINITAINIVDNGEDGLLRLIASDVAAARRILMQQRVPARVDNVIAVSMRAIWQDFSLLLQLLKEADIKITYSYALNGDEGGKSAMVFRFSDNDRAIEVLQQNGVDFLNEKAIAQMSKAA